MMSFVFYRYNLSCFIAPWLLWLAFYGCFSSCPLVARLLAPDFSPVKGKALSFAFGGSASCCFGSLLVSGLRLCSGALAPVPAKAEKVLPRGWALVVVGYARALSNMKIIEKMGLQVTFTKLQH